jgi:hypothetical protein
VNSLPTPLRRQLESAIRQARKIAEAGARHALEALAVHEPDPYRHMDEAARALRRHLRAQAKQLGDGESLHKPGAYEIKHLAEKLAYDQWHRLLFARYLLENNLLISPEHGVAVSLDDCEELAPSVGLKDAWAVAARFAAKELPEIFRANDPAGAVELAVNDRKPLIALVTGLPLEVFTASDSLGWCYQFWQAEKKDEVNAAGNKIGADELPAVTQLFTEDYMVDFLLDNTLGAWHAGKVLTARPDLAKAAASETELREAVALPGCPWTYLRFTQADEGAWAPAAGTFDGWPRTAKELKCLDPCMGSGHFVVAMFERVVALRLAEEGLDEAEAVAAVVGENLFGLELDPRCTQIGAFNLALAAWRRVGHCALPAMNVACSGLAPNANRADWLSLAGGDDRLERGMARLYAMFADAPVLGSLINPRVGEGDLIVAAFHEIQPLLEVALAQEGQGDNAHELAVTARGLAKAAEILSGRFTLVATNVPYLGISKHPDEMLKFIQEKYEVAKYDLATVFLERMRELLEGDGVIAAVTLGEWLYLGPYLDYRMHFLRTFLPLTVVRLGWNAFSTPIRANPALVIASGRPNRNSSLGLMDGSSSRTVDRNRLTCLEGVIDFLSIAQVEKNPDSRFLNKAEDDADIPLLSAWAEARSGLHAGDLNQFFRFCWEVADFTSTWEAIQTAVNSTAAFTGREQIVRWEKEQGTLAALADSVKHLNHAAQNWRAGKPFWGKRGVIVGLMGNAACAIYSGDRYDVNSSAIVPKNEVHLAALWCFCESGEFSGHVRRLDNSLKLSPQTLLKVPFDLAHWQTVAAEKYPHGLPKPFSSDPTQWIFNGHPKDSDQPLHVAVARLLGYQWPRQTGSCFPDCPALGPDGLEAFADADGIVPISPTKGEAAAAERLRDLLARAYGQEWSASRQQELLAQVDSAGASLEDWLRNAFFEQHCKLFQNRPFIWNVWDGHKSGFSALVNYHKLTHANLEKLTYAYLGDWIRRQQAAVEAGESGSDARLQAAKNLQATLKLILEGEPPFDIFVRWKPLSQQAIGWQPDLNDGVRMNIRPFMARDIPGGKKGAGVLRAKPNIKWEKDRGKEPTRPKAEYPWFWGWDEKRQDFAGVGQEPDGNRWNDCHYSNQSKRLASGTKEPQ